MPEPVAVMGSPLGLVTASEFQRRLDVRKPVDDN